MSSMVRWMASARGGDMGQLLREQLAVLREQMKSEAIAPAPLGVHSGEGEAEEDE